MLILNFIFSIHLTVLLDFFQTIWLLQSLKKIKILRILNYCFQQRAPIKNNFPMLRLPRSTKLMIHNNIMKKQQPNQNGEHCHEKQTTIQLQQEQEKSENQFDIQNQSQGSKGEGKWKKIEKPEKCIKLYMIDFNQCDGKKCTGRKMQRFSMLKSIKDKDKKKKFRGVVLSAFGQKPISIQDLDICVKNGLCVIDCSWNRIEQTSQFRFKNERILPYVVAGNPVNYGKPFQLSCVQALATALCAINYVPQAEYIMSKFGWADGFWSINSRIKDYGTCRTASQLSQMSKQVQQSENTLKQRSYDISDSSSQRSISNNSQEQQNEQAKLEQTQEKKTLKQKKATTPR